MEDNLGDRLRTARNAAGISVDDAVYLAKIPRSVVEALENEDFGFFTSPLYARSFLKQYSEYVGADVDQWLDHLEPITMIDCENVESFINLSEPVATVVSHKKKKNEAKNGGGAWAALWIIVITGGLVWGALKFVANFESKHAETQSTAEKPASEAETAPNQEPGEETTPEPEPKPIASTIPEPTPRAIPVLPDGE